MKFPVITLDQKARHKVIHTYQIGNKENSSMLMMEVIIEVILG